MGSSWLLERPFGRAPTSVCASSLSDLGPPRVHRRAARRFSGARVVRPRQRFAPQRYWPRLVGCQQRPHRPFRMASDRSPSLPSTPDQSLRHAQRQPGRDQHQANKKARGIPKPRAGEHLRRSFDVARAQRADGEHAPHLVTGKARAVHASASSHRPRLAHRHPTCET